MGAVENRFPGTMLSAQRQTSGFSPEKSRKELKNGPKTTFPSNFRDFWPKNDGFCGWKGHLGPKFASQETRCRKTRLEAFHRRQIFLLPENEHSFSMADGWIEVGGLRHEKAIP